MWRSGTRCHNLEDKIRILTAGIAWNFKRKYLNTRMETRSERYSWELVYRLNHAIAVCVSILKTFSARITAPFHELYIQHVPVPRLFRPAIRVASALVCTWITSTSFNLRRFITTNKGNRWYICLMKHWNLKDLTRRYLQIIFMFEADGIFNVRHKKRTGHFTRLCYKHFAFYLTILHITAISKGTLSIVVKELGPIWQVITGNKQYGLSSVVSHFTYPLGFTCHRWNTGRNVCPLWTGWEKEN